MIDRIAIFFLAGVLFFGFHLSHAETGDNLEKNELLAIGASTVVGGNSALAKERAITQALMKGVEDYIARLLGSRGVVNNFERLTEEIIPGAKEEIENFHILAEHQADGKYKVLIKLRVNEEIIGEKLRSAGVLLTDPPTIKVLFLVSEIIGGDISYWWKDAESFKDLSAVELTLHKVFQDRGFSPINRISSPPDVESLSNLTSPNLTNEDILKWGSLFSADVVICGQSEIINKKELSLKLRVFDVHQGSQICQESRVEPIEQASTGSEQIIETLQGPVNRIAAMLCPCIIRAVASEHGEIHPLEVTLTGTNKPKQFWVFRDFLRDKVVGVKSVIPSKIKGNSVSATVEFQGDGDKFIN
ncbi:MAG: hypothetical protein MUP08_06035, partial [Desulfobulbaceae bacterium]|nr:hypothetical protein [Desulfobulbaceae bacterium]